MKQLSCLFTALLVLAMVSCSSSNEPKMISPTSTEFTSGGLAKYIEVVDEPCELSYAEQDGAIGTQYIKLKVKLRLARETPELQNVDARDLDFTGLLSVATVNLVDKNETTIQDLDVKSEDLLKLKKFLQGSPDDEVTITFIGEFHNSDDAPKWFEQTVAFTPYLTADVSAGDDVETSYSSDSSYDFDGTHDMFGNVGDYPITMHIEIDGSSVKGSYFYDKQGPNAQLKLSGTNENGILDINETDANGTPTGHFKGRMFSGVFKGVFITNKGDKLAFMVSEVGVSADGFSSDSDISYNDDDFSNGDSYDSEYDEDDNDDDDSNSISGVSGYTSGEGDASIDAFINEYEKFWKKYMSFVKKVNKNDPSFMVEYANLIADLNEYNNKLQKVKGNLSMDQLNRLNKMNAEMMKEMQKLK